MRIEYKRSLTVTSTILTITTWMLCSDAQASHPVQQDDGACSESQCGCSDGCNSGCSGGYGAGCLGACSMPPHYMYFPQNHGNYYFRPYNYHTILHQQQAVGRYGGDRRNPYDNTLFQSLYEEVENGGNQEVIAVPDPLSADLTPRIQDNKPAPVLRDEGSNPPKVFIEPVALESIREKSSDSTFRVRFITDK